MTKKNKIVIFDLDGTLAIIDKRRALAGARGTKKRMNWKVFFDPLNIALDEPNVPVIELFKTLKKDGYTMVIFSGRDSISEDMTKLWLEKHGVKPDFMRMRPKNTYTPDNDLKQSWLDELNVDGLTKDDVMMVFDDRDQVVKMWRENGLTVSQVNYGDF